MGDSISYGISASPGNSFAALLYGDFQGSLSADAMLNRAQPGATAGSGRGTQLALALADINGPSDTVAMTVGFGGNEALSGTCSGGWDQASCPLRENLDYILFQLKTALDGDPGTEFAAVLAYYNPRVETSQEGAFDQILLGADGEIGCLDSGQDVGLNDVIFQEAGDYLLPVANTYPPMKAAGSSAIASDRIHPNDAGHAVIAQAFRDAEPLCLPTPDLPSDLEEPPGPTPKCKGETATIVAQPGQVTRGTAGRDVIVGSSQRDVIRAGERNDLVCAGAGNDDVRGADGRDTVAGGNGTDLLAGQGGRDVLFGQGGPDRLFGGTGRDRLSGGAGADQLFGGPAVDRLLGGPGADRVRQ